MTLPFSPLYAGSPALIVGPNVSAPTLATTGGTIAASTNVNAAVAARVGSVTTLATVAGVVTTGAGTSTNAATITWDSVPGATSYQVYVSAGTIGSNPLLLITTVTAGTGNTYVWTGTTGAGALPSVSGFTPQTLIPAVASGTTALLLGIVASNPTIYTGQLFLNRVSTGGTAVPIVSGTPVPPDSAGGQPIDLARKHVLLAGEYVTGYVTVPGIGLTLDGMVK